MDQKNAAGLIIYRHQRTPEFLLINDSFAGRRHWTPPKGCAHGAQTAPQRGLQVNTPLACGIRGQGHAYSYTLNGEDSLKTALREAQELTGLSARDLRVEPSFSKTIKYASLFKAPATGGIPC